jgi:hypothetical protein
MLDFETLDMSISPWEGLHISEILFIGVDIIIILLGQSALT